jgi:hypothetical protein
MTQPLIPSVSAAISIILPHLRNTDNDKALRIALDTLVTHTDMDYELLLEAVAERRDIYPVVNSMAEQATTDWLVFWNSDTFASPNWIRPLWDARAVNTIVSPVMVECGAIPVNDKNLERDFGRTPETFRRGEFEAWVSAGGEWREHWREDQQAWYFPSLMNRNRFLAQGGFDGTRGQFPENELDMFFWETWAANGGQFKRVKSWIYHLQAYSETGRGVR